MELFVKLLAAELLLEYSIVERLGRKIPKFLVFMQEDLEVSLYRSSNPNSHTGFGSQLIIGRALAGLRLSTSNVDISYAAELCFATTSMH